MRFFRHHGNIDCRRHTLLVAERAYVFSCRWHADTLAVLRGALLHDFYLYDWHSRDLPPFHGFRHPYRALREAEMRFQLNSIERDCIKNHMFPLTPFPPKYKESWIVNWADKSSTVSDYAGMFKLATMEAEPGLEL
ncbi:MAG: phosphohydrolase [Spirochaetales bacterium]|uniref:Phosphohydrolase n=1 Tax=Candidatus Thalassospirochaeta sargassi TaxID=3119039 RepID=A0AAJ1MJT1_9SPIO|nr:phosphohydrolase [Spirochaetales bacterium]